MKKGKIKVLLIEPMCHPKPYYVEPSMKAFADIVNEGAAERGEVEAKKLEKRIYAIFNKDRFFTDLAPNRNIDDDIIVGKMFIVAINKKRMPISLTDDQMTKYAYEFWNTETFDDIDVVEANMKTFTMKLLVDEKL